jgi:hypothetical protein
MAVEVVTHMKTNGEEIADQKNVEKILISLPENYDYIVTAIEVSKDLSTMSVEQLMSSLEFHEQRRSRCADQSVESNFQSNLLRVNLKDYSRRAIRERSKREQIKEDERKMTQARRKTTKMRKVLLLRTLSLLVKFVRSQIMIL